MRKGTSPPAAGASADGETAESAAAVEEESVEAPWLACETSWSSDGAFNAAPGPSLTTCSVFPLRSELCEGFASSKFADSAGGRLLWSSGASAAGLASADASGLPFALFEGSAASGFAASVAEASAGGADDSVGDAALAFAE